MRKEGLGRRLLTLTLGLLLAALMLVKPAWADELPTVEVPTVGQNLVYNPGGVVILDNALFATDAQWGEEPWLSQWALVSKDGKYRVVIKTDPTGKLVVNDEGKLTSIAAGEYALEFELVKGDTPPFPNLYQWSDGTTDNQSANVTVAPLPVTLPSVPTEAITFDGNAHTVLDVELTSWEQNGPFYSGTSRDGSIIVSASTEVASKLALNSETHKLEATEVGEYGFTIEPGHVQNIPPYQPQVYNYAWSGAEAGKEYEQITVTSSITAATIAVPTAAAESFTYSGSEQTLVADGVHYTLTEITPAYGEAKARIDENGNAVATYANTYTVTATPDSNYAWADAGEGKETEPVTIEVTIDRAAATKPEAQTAEYNGEHQIVLDVALTSWRQTGPSTFSGTSTDGSIVVSASSEVASKLALNSETHKLEATEVGEYGFTIEPGHVQNIPPYQPQVYNYAWSGAEAGTETEQITVKSSITRAKLKKPETPVTVGYTDQPQVVLDIALESWGLFPPAGAGKYGGVSSDGRYVVTASADEGAKLTRNTDGKLTATDSGDYVFSVEPKAESVGPTTLIYNYEWEDGTVDPVQVTYTISSHRFVEKPTAGSFTYNGSEQTLAEVADGAGYKLSGQTKGTNAGTYTVTATLDNGYAWKPEEGGTESTAAYEFTVTIAQAELAAAQVAEIAEQTETGSAIEPAVSVTFNGAAVPASEYTVSYSNNVNPGTATATITATDGGNFKGKTSTSFTIKANPTKTDYNVTIAATTNVYRVYNPNSGEHLYTTNKGEYDNLVAAGWNGENVAWQSVEGGTPVYRVYNPNAGEHHYTASAAERDALVAAGWNDEGVAFNAASATSGTPVYRVYNPNKFSCNHHWTTSKAEYDHLVSIGWNDEGIAFYV